MDQNNVFYSNQAFVTSSIVNIVIEFRLNLPSLIDDKIENNSERVATAIMSPQQFKAFVEASKNQLGKYEQLYGEIPLPELKDAESK
jgi:hypothetical protein